jgi:peptidoglycan/LPS O-acetylase OafA/YrhL
MGLLSSPFPPVISARSIFFDVDRLRGSSNFLGRRSFRIVELLLQATALFIFVLFLSLELFQISQKIFHLNFSDDLCTRRSSFNFALMVRSSSDLQH